MLKYLLDTHMVIDAIRNRPQSLRQQFNRLQGQMAISSVTWGNLFMVLSALPSLSAIWRIWNRLAPDLR